MAEFEYHRVGNSQAQEKEALSRLFAQTGLLAAPGVLGGLVVSQNTTADGNVLIAAGSCVLHPTMTAGASLLVCDSQKTLDIFTANPLGGLPRNDIVAFDSITASILAIIGTPNATPSDPTVPDTAIALARLRHSASAPTIPAAKIDSLIVPTTLRGISTAGTIMGTPTTSAATGTVTSAATETRDAVLGNFVFTAVAGRRYEARMNGLLVAAGVAGDLVGVRIRNGGASTPTAASALVAHNQTVVTATGGPGQEGLTVDGTFIPGAGVQTLSAFFVRLAGTGTETPLGLRELYVVDTGPA